MAYMQYYDQYRLLLKTGRMPIPYPYNIQYINTAPNLNNDDNCWNNYYSSIPRDMYFTYGPDVQPDQLPCYDTTPFTDPSVAAGFDIVRLVSNTPQFSPNFDINLLQPWGVIVANDKIWVTNTGTGLITCYNLRGVPLLPVINVFGPLGGIAQTTGISYNFDPKSFMIYNGPLQGSSALIVCTREGTIHGYNSLVNSNVAQILFDMCKTGAVYTGIQVVNIVNNSVVRSENTRIGCINRRNLMYVTDFYNQKIDVYDGDLNVVENFMFVDEDSDDPIPSEYSPYNIVNIRELLYVTFAKQRPVNSQYEECGAGFGFVSIFNLNGEFVKRFTSRGALNAPWGVVEAPSAFGYPAGSIMVSNYGDGCINVFNIEGCYLGSVRDCSYNSICFGGLRGLCFNPACPKQLYWVSNENSLKQAYVGTISTKMDLF